MVSLIGWLPQQSPHYPAPGAHSWSLQFSYLFVSSLVGDGGYPNLGVPGQYRAGGKGEGVCVFWSRTPLCGRPAPSTGTSPWRGQAEQRCSSSESGVGFRCSAGAGLQPWTHRTWGTSSQDVTAPSYKQSLIMFKRNWKAKNLSDRIWKPLSKSSIVTVKLGKSLWESKSGSFT